MTPAHTTRHPSDRGQALVEYTLLLGLVTVTCMVALQQLGGDVNGIFQAVDVVLRSIPGA
jgi:Flp pilus assembly pilin Flp